MAAARKHSTVSFVARLGVGGSTLGSADSTRLLALARDCARARAVVDNHGERATVPLRTRARVSRSISESEDESSLCSSRRRRRLAGVVVVSRMSGRSNGEGIGSALGAITQWPRACELARLSRELSRLRDDLGPSCAQQLFLIFC